jgi:hypothetical protein
MFPDSDIARQIKLQRTKVAYTINFGLAQYFFRELLDLCSSCDHYVLGFDESLNKVVEKGQIDLFIRFWDTNSNQVCTRYYASSFMGHATAADLTSFQEATKDLSFSKLLQISMDGPNVNKKFLKDLIAELKEDNADAPIPLNL